MLDLLSCSVSDEAKMQKRCMRKLITVVALVILAPALDAAPVTSEVPDLQKTSLRGDEKPTDPWTSGPDIRDMTTYFDAQEMTVPVRPSGRLDKAINSPHFLDKILAATNAQGRRMNLASVPIGSVGLENIVAATNSLDNQLNLGSLMEEPEIEDRVPMVDSSVREPLTLIPAIVNSNKQSKTKRAKMNSASSTADRREKMLHMLSALEELHRSLNNTLNSHLTFLTRGNSNSRSQGKKNKMISEGNTKSTTVSSVVSRGASAKASTDQVDPKLLNGKAFKKSFPSTPKKTNKRVCFWKYCSQN